MPTRAFTTTANSGLLNVLKNQCKISAAYDPRSGGTAPPLHEFTAIWDTGATNSVITQAVVDACGLVATGMAVVHGVSGPAQSETFLVNLGLPNMVMFPNLRVTKGTFSGADILVGMDVISEGDFAVTNFNLLSKFSFRLPSLVHIDFVQEWRDAQQKPAVGRPGRAERRRKKFGRN